MNDNINTLIEDAQNSSETYESCESVLPMDIETNDNVIEETMDSADDILIPLKSDEDLIEEINGMAEKQKDSAKRLKDIDIRIGLANNIMQCLNINFESVSEEVSLGISSFDYFFLITILCFYCLANCVLAA